MLFSQQPVAVPAEMGDGVGRGVFAGCAGLPFGDAPTKGIVGIGPVVWRAVAGILDAHAAQLVLGIPGHMQLPVTARRLPLLAGHWWGAVSMSWPLR